ncbi:TPA: hypothetical protein ACKLSE_002218 [Neisseria gonorrhoeae]
MFGSHGLCGLPEEGVHGKSPKCLGGNLGDFRGILQRSSGLYYKIWEGGWRMPALPFFRTSIPMLVQNRMESIFNHNKDAIFLEGWGLGDAAMIMELLWQNISTSRRELTKLFLYKNFWGCTR